MMTTGRAQSWALALTATASLMVALDALVVATALSTIRRDLHASLSTLEWTVNAYSLSFAVLLMTGAALGDRFGRRRVFVIGLGVFVAASAACALAPTVGWLIAARTVQGAGSALVMPLAMALLGAAIPPERRGAALGIFTALTGLAVVGGPLVGGFISQSLAWQWIFWVNLPLGVAVIPLVLAHIEESRGPRTRPDVVGVALVSGGALGLVWGMIRANSVGWGSAEVIATLAAGAVLIGAFVRWELHVDQPMLPMRFFADRGFAAGNASAFMLYASLYGMVFYIAQYLQVALGYSPFAAGLRFLPWTALMFVVAPVSGRLADRIGGRPLVAAGLTLQGVGAGWIAANAAGGRSYASSIIALMISGVGLSMAMPAVQNLVLNAVPPSALGKASGTFNTVRQLGGVFGVAVLAAVFSANGSYASPRAFGSGSGAALAVAAALAGTGAVIALLAAARARRRVPVPAAPPAAVTEPARVG
jgi:EmrB/QacA subfamily drug resistance transporter